MPDEQIPPQLSEDGAQLLSDVLARRSALRTPTPRVDKVPSRHATPIARASAVRRLRDPLRSAVPAVDLIDLRRDRRHEVATSAPRSASLILPVLLSGMAIGALIVSLTVWLSPSPPEPEVRVAGAVEERSPDVRDSGTGLVVVDSSSPSDVTGTGGADIDPKSVEVSIFDVDPAVNGVRSFALRVKSLDTTRTIATDEFSVVVESTTGRVTTFVRFEHLTLPIGSSALATVRAEGADAGPLVVVVRVGDVVIASVPIV